VQLEAVAASLRQQGIELSAVETESEALALIAYLQSLGHAVRAAEGGVR
jgi:cbb3-type cytochrome oxidase cytochrome c subunit